ncbi:hypothetical protein GCM10028784_26020 [Myceligenerans cantabricum]
MPYPSHVDPAQIGPRALAVVEASGWDRWSLREIAGELGVSPNALYRYVDGRDGLVVAIGAAAAWAVHGALVAVEGEGEDHLISMADAYVNFAVERPHAFAALVHAKPALNDPRVEPWTVLWHHLLEHFEQVVPQNGSAAGFAYLALVHGRAELARGPARQAAPTAGLADAVHALISGYRAIGKVPDPVPAELRPSVSRDI